MTVQVTTTAYGRPALQALRAAVAQLKGADLMAPVTVLVPNNIAGIVARRFLARGLTGHWRESYVGMVQQDGTWLEGFVDLIYREDDGSLVIVDYKTDQAPDAVLPSRVSYYAPQLNAYRTIVDKVVGGQSATPILVFARETTARSLKVT